MKFEIQEWENEYYFVKDYITHKNYLSLLDIEQMLFINLAELSNTIKKYNGNINKSDYCFYSKEGARKFLEDIIMPNLVASKLIKKSPN